MEEGLQEALRRIEDNFTSKAKSLNLDRLKLKYIPKEISLLSHLVKLDLNSNRIEKISNLNQLKNLTELDLGSNYIKKIEGLNHLQNLEILSLKLNQIIRLEGLKRLKNLSKLDLRFNKIIKLKGLEHLQNLVELDLWHNKIEKIEGLKRLKKLIKLNFNSNQINKIEGLEQLQNLEILNFSGNQISKIEGLEDPKKLEWLHLDFNNINKIEGLEQLQNLSWLSLQNNKIEKIEGLEQLQNLKILILQNNQISRIEGLEQLQKLEVLHIATNQISKIEGIDKLKNLFSLSLDSNRINTIESLEQLQKLKILYLGKNQISKIKGLDNQTYLELVDISNNQITNLLPITNIFKKNIELKITNDNKFIESGKSYGFNICNNPLEQPPIEIAEKGIIAIKNYFESFVSDEELVENDFLNEAKLLLVGEERSGKSTIAELLVYPNYNFELGKKSTEGIDVLNWNIKKEESGLDDDFTFHIWDFGGQDVYHATHQYFLTKQSLYIFITQVRKDLHFDEFYYWLNIINTLAPNCPILVLQNKAEEPHQKQSIEFYTNTFPQIINKNIIEISCDNTHEDWENIYAENLQAFKNSIYSILKEKKLPGYGDPLPPKWVSVREKIGTLKESGRNHIPYSEYEKVCLEEQLSISQAKTLAGYLYRIGVFTWFEDMDMKETVYLNNKWVLDALYKVLDNKTIERSNGKFEKELLNELWSADTYRGKQSSLFKLLTHRKFKICYQADDQFCYVPAHFTTTAKVVNWQEGKNHLKYKCKFDFIPKGILSQLIVVFHQYIVDDVYWRFGVLIENKNTKALLTEINFNKDSALQIEIEGPNRAELLYNIKKEIQEICSIFPNLNYQHTYACKCEECKQINKPYYFTEERIKKQNRKRQNYY